ncbi:MAG: hypothetical protein K9J77_07435 [Rhodoferax sp.]|nr:hypothetical protein [Rhodoferax sp.]
MKRRAEAEMRVLSDAQSSLVTREHIDSKFAVVEAKMDKLQWMLAAVLAVAIANFAKQYF